MYEHGYAPLCDACLEQHLQWHRGVAQCRGEGWARAIANVCPIDVPWPRTERARQIARRKVADLASDERLLELLADECELGAERWWNAQLAKSRAG